MGGVLGLILFRALILTVAIFTIFITIRKQGFFLSLFLSGCCIAYTFKGYADIRPVLFSIDDNLVKYEAMGGPRCRFLKKMQSIIAKMMEFLFNSSCLTDGGCTMHCINQNALHHIKKYVTVNGNCFGPDGFTLIILNGLSLVKVRGYRH